MKTQSSTNVRNRAAGWMIPNLIRGIKGPHDVQGAGGVVDAAEGEILPVGAALGGSETAAISSVSNANQVCEDPRRRTHEARPPYR